MVGAALARHPAVDKIAFTGSTEVGKSLLRAVGETDVKAITLELGGKSPQVVLADVGDLEAAASSIGWGIFYNSGQTCNAGSRLVVHRSVREELVERIAELGRELAPGEPLDPATRLGAIVDDRQLDEGARLRDARPRGGRAGRRRRRARPRGDRRLLRPADDPRRRRRTTWRVAREEIFGPVLTVTEFEDEADALRIANDTPFGLAAGIWTRDVKKAHRAGARDPGRDRLGQHVRHGRHHGPVRRVQAVGFGRDKGLAALDGYTQLKTTWIDLAGE